MALGSTQHLTEMSTRNRSREYRVAGRPYRHLRADCLEDVEASMYSNLWAFTACYLFLIATLIDQASIQKFRLKLRSCF
jgi:hypothetical protein